MVLWSRFFVEKYSITAILDLYLNLISTNPQEIISYTAYYFSLLHDFLHQFSSRLVRATAWLLRARSFLYWKIKGSFNDNHILR